jgi:hypothetical protein
MCDAVDTFTLAAQDETADVKSMLADPNPDLGLVRQTFVGYFEDLIHTASMTIDQLKRAGIPAVPKGTSTADGVIDGFRKVRTSLRAVRKRAAAISVDDQRTAAAQLKALDRYGTALDRSYGKLISGLKHLDQGHQLTKAYRASAVCRYRVG